MRTHRFPSRPHVQGVGSPVRLCHNASGLTDGAGLLLVRQLWDRLQLGARIDHRTTAVDRRYRSSLLIEVWVALLLYGGKGEFSDHREGEEPRVIPMPRNRRKLN